MDFDDLYKKPEDKEKPKPVLPRIDFDKLRKQISGPEEEQEQQAAAPSLPDIDFDSLRRRIGEEPEKTGVNLLKDPLASIARGTTSLAQAAATVSNLPKAAITEVVSGGLRGAGLMEDKTARQFSKMYGIEGLAMATSGFDAVQKGLEGFQSDQWRESTAKEFIKEVEGGEGWFGSKWKPGEGLTSPVKIADMILQSIPASVAGMGGGVVATKAMIGLTNAAGKAVMKPAIAGIIGGAIGEGSVAGGMAFNQMVREMQGLSDEEVVSSPYFQEKYGQNITPDNIQLARNAMSLTGGLMVGIVSAMGVGVLGSPSGAFIGRALGGEAGKTLFGTIIKSAALEGFQEFTQEPTEQLIENIATKWLVDRNQSLTEGLGEAAIGGFLSGAVMGGGLGKVAHTQGAQERQQQEAISLLEGFTGRPQAEIGQTNHEIVSQMTENIIGRNPSPLDILQEKIVNSYLVNKQDTAHPDIYTMYDVALDSVLEVFPKEQVDRFLGPHVITGSGMVSRDVLNEIKQSRPDVASAMVDRIDDALAETTDPKERALLKIRRDDLTRGIVSISKEAAEKPQATTPPPIPETAAAPTGQEVVPPPVPEQAGVAPSAEPPSASVPQEKTAKKPEGQEIDVETEAELEAVPDEDLDRVIREGLEKKIENVTARLNEAIESGQKGRETEYRKQLERLQAQYQEYTTEQPQKKKEVKDAEKIREDEGAVQGGRPERQRGEEEGGPDLQQPAEKGAKAGVSEEAQVAPKKSLSDIKTKGDLKEVKSDSKDKELETPKDVETGGPADTGAVGTGDAGQTWNEMDRKKRLSQVRKAGHAAPDGKVTAKGHDIANTAWEKLSPEIQGELSAAMGIEVEKTEKAPDEQIQGKEGQAEGEVSGRKKYYANVETGKKELDLRKQATTGTEKTYKYKPFNYKGVEYLAVQVNDPGAKGVSYEVRSPTGFVVNSYKKKGKQLSFSAGIKAKSLKAFKDRVETVLFDGSAEILDDYYYEIKQKEPIGRETKTTEPEKPGADIVKGKTYTTYTANNQPIDFYYAVVDISQVVSSHDTTFATNKDFPSELQPRGRDRKGMRAQVLQYANNINPAKLGESPSVASGAPMVGQDMIVESGNGRKIALEIAYENDRARHYKEWLLKNADRLNITAKEVQKTNRPILVRVRTTPVDRVSFVAEANRDEVARMSPYEQAVADAERITREEIQMFKPSEDGNIVSAANRPFIDLFLKKLGTNEAAGYLTSEGNLTRQGADRIQAAIFAKAYQNEGLISLQAEEANPDIKNIINALTMAASEFAEASTLEGFKEKNLIAPIIEGIKFVRQSRRDGVSIKQIINQIGMFEGKTPEGIMVAEFIDQNIRSGKRMGTAFKRIGHRLKNDLLDKDQQNLFDVGESLSAIDYLKEGFESVQRKETGEQGELFSEPSERGGGRREQAGGERTPVEDAGRGKERAGKKPAKPETKIEDFGEVLEGARKHYYQEYAGRVKDVPDSEIANEPFSKSWPQPDYQRLIDGGADPIAVSFIRVMRETIKNKPKRYGLGQWVEDVKMGRDVSQKLLNGDISVSKLKELSAKPEYRKLQPLFDTMELYQAVGHEKSLKGLSLVEGQYSTFQGVEYKPAKTIYSVEKAPAKSAYSNWPSIIAYGDTKEQAIENFKKKYHELDDVTKKAKTSNRYEIRQYSFSHKDPSKRGKVFITRKGTNYFELKKFDSVKEAREFLQTNQEWLDKQVEKFKVVPEERKESNAPRMGEDHRNGLDVTPEQFDETFGFRGVQFGNYVEQGKRQQDINDAYDALMDMAGVLGLPPKSLSLNGELGLAFGARGSGKLAKAHYERDTVVINLTKKQGAGSLAHEWWHAVDNYFARQRGERLGYLTLKPTERGEGVRPEMVKAFQAIMNTIKTSGLSQRSKALDQRRTKKYWSQPYEMAARAFENYLIEKLKDQGVSNDYLANIVSNEAWDASAQMGLQLENTYPYVTAKEMPAIRQAFDRFFDTVETRETETGVAMFHRKEELSGRAIKLQETVNMVLNRFPGLKKDMVQVFQSENQLPGKLQAALKKQNMTGKFDALIWDGKIYLVADNLTNESVAELSVVEGLLRHEGRHYAIEQIFGGKKARDDFFGQVAEKYAGSVDAYLRKHKLEDTPENRIIAAEEVIIDRIRAGETGGIIDRFIARIANFLRTLFPKLKISNAEVRELIARADRIIEGKNEVVPIGQLAADTRYQIAHHGSQHTWAPEPGFPHGRPRLDKIGTGEGAQSYGWGIYFAESSDVADTYKVAGINIKDRLIRQYAEDIIKMHGSAAAAIEYAKKSDDPIIQEAGQWLEGGRQGEGSVYKLDIPDSVMPKLLDFDKPLSEQSDQVKSILKEHGLYSKGHMTFDEYKNQYEGVHSDDTLKEMYEAYTSIPAGEVETLGVDLYDNLKNQLRSEKAASEYLASIGIPGNKFLDQFSRQEKEGTHNYVIWDQKTLDRIALLERNQEKLQEMQAEEGARFLMGGQALATEKGLERLETAKRMIGDPEKIWRETGWWNLGGDWKFEISPENATINSEAFTELVVDSIVKVLPKGQRLNEEMKIGDQIKNPEKPVKTVPLKKIYDYPELYELFPMAKDIKVAVNFDPREVSYRSRSDNLISLSVAAVRGHEALGWIKDYTFPADRFRSILEHEIQHVVQDIEKFPRGGNAATFVDPKKQAKISELRKRYRELDKKDPSKITDADLTERQLIQMELQDIVSKARSEAFEKYLSLTGEAEARMVQRRLKMTPEQRNAEPPWVTLEKMLRREGLLKKGQKVEDVLIDQQAGDKSLSVESETDIRFSRKPAQVSKEEARSLNPEVQKRFKAAQKGVEKPTFGQKAKDIINQAKETFTRHFIHLDSKKDGAVIDVLRRFQETPTAMWEEAGYQTVRFIKDMDQNSRDVFVYNLVLGDMLRDVEAGTLELRRGERLPFGYRSVKEVQADFDHFQKVADKVPEIKKALEERAKFMGNLRKDLVKHKLLPKDVLKADPNEYFHHQVLDYMILKKSPGISSKDLRTKKKGWQFARAGSLKDYSTNYLESEIEVISQGLVQVKTQEALDRIRKLEDKKGGLERDAYNQNIAALEKMFAEMGEMEDPLKPFKTNMAIGFSGLEKMAAKGELYAPDEYRDVVADLVKKSRERKEKDYVGSSNHPKMFQFLSWLINTKSNGAMEAATIFKAIKNRNRFIKDTLGKDFKTYRDLIPEGYTEWKPKPGQAFYFTNSLADKVLEDVLSGHKSLGESDVRKVLARGRDAVWVIPDRIATTLDDFKPPRIDSLPEKLSVGALNKWKQWVLINPYRIVRYNINNMSGDLDISLAYDPKIAAMSFKAAKDLWKDYGKGKWEIDEALRKELDEAREAGVIGTGMTQMDIPDPNMINRMDEFMDVLDGKPPKGLLQKSKKGIQWYWEQSKGLTSWRENIIRLAAYRYFKDRLSKPDGRNVYAASKVSEIDAMWKAGASRNEIAAKLSRELIGDYGNLSQGGQWLRHKLIPFYSWIEINVPRYVRLLRNLKHEGRSTAGLGGVMAWKATKLGLKASLLFAMVNLWNATMFPDEDDELGEAKRHQMHLILGRREDGTIVTLRFQGALSDALSWFGQENPIETYRMLSKGDYSGETMRAIKAPADKIITGIRPEPKMLFETLTGSSLYPDPFSPKPIRDRMQHVLRTFSLDKLYNIAVGKPSKAGDWKGQFVEDLKSMFLYETDPGEVAYWETRSQVFDYLKKQGHQAPTIHPTNKSNALYYYRQAIKYGDLAAAAKYYQKYIEYGGNAKNIAESIKRAHPMSSLPLKDRYGFRQSLSEKELKTLDVALSWYRDTYLSGSSR